MARLRDGEKSSKERQVEQVLRQSLWGKHEMDVAEELGWQRRTANNYLRELERQGKVYKEGRSWFVDE